MNGKLTIKDFAVRIKAKYPDYASMGDLELTRKIVAKYPDYQNQLDAPVPMTPDSGVEPDPGILAKTGDVITDVAKGAGKGVLSTGLNVSKMVGAVPDNTTMADIGMEPTNTAQKVGMGIEQVGEFFVPAGAITKGTKAVQAAVSTAPKVVRGAANLAAKAGLEAAGAGAVTAAQGGDVTTAAGISAAIPVVGATVAPIAYAAKTMLSTKLPGRLIESLIKPPKALKKFGREPGEEVAIQGLKANTLEGLEKEIAERGNKVGAIIDAELKLPANAAKRVDVAPLINGPIDDAIKRAKIDGNEALVNRLEAFRNGQFVERFGAAGNVKSLKLSPLDARKLKTDLGKGFHWSDNAIEGTLNDVRQDIYRNINNAIEAQVPGTKTLNKSYANLLSAEKSVQARIDAVNKLNLVGLTTAGLGAATAIVTAMADGSINDSIVNALLVGGAIKATKSPRVVTELAGTLAKLSPAERTVVAKAVPLLRNIYLAGSN